MAEQAPRGWYPDPSGRPGQRWWDGVQWTDFTQDATPSATTPPSYGNSPNYGVPTYGAGLPLAAQSSRFPSPYAGFWTRVLAAIVDALILGVPFVAVGLFLFWPELSDYVDEVLAGGSPQFDETLVLRFIAFALVGTLISGLYDVLLIAYRGATVGMSVMRIHCVDATGSMPTLGRSFIRWGFAQVFSFASNLVPLVGGAVALLDPLWMLWDNENQTLHDKVASTWVLQR